MGHSHHHHHHHHGHGHAGHHHHGESHGNIKVAFWLNSAFAVIELIGGLYTNSVAITSDALHDFGDSLSLGLAYYFEKKSNKARDDDFSYGYKRFSLLGAFINSMVLVVGSILIIQESISRIIHPEPANAKGMLILSIVGISVNTIAMLRLRRGSSVNERVVSLHFLEDVLGWTAVLVGSVVMMFVDVPIIDPILSILIAGFILFNVYKNFREAFHIILQGIPQSLNMDEIKEKIKSVAGVRDLHDLHTWTLDGNYNVMTVHIIIDDDQQSSEIKNEIRAQLKALHIEHLTIEIELENESCTLKDC